MKRRATNGWVTKAAQRFLSRDIQFVHVDAIKLVTFDDPQASIESADGAFARIRPPADHPAEETLAWRERVKARAITVRVLASDRSALVPAELARAASARSSFRDIAVEMPRALDPKIEALVIEMMEECGC